MRSLVNAAVCAIVLATISSLAAAQQQGTRMSWETFIQDPARVQSLRNAIAIMRSRNSADRTSALYRTSWEYWAAMHGYFGPGSPFGTVENGRAAYQNSGGDPFLFPLFNGITNTTPPDAVAQQVWGQCQHGTRWFFAWHRLYLYYFEQVLQAAANDPTCVCPIGITRTPPTSRCPRRTPTARTTTRSAISSPIRSTSRAAFRDGTRPAATRSIPPPRISTMR